MQVACHPGRHGGRIEQNAGLQAGTVTRFTLTTVVGRAAASGRGSAGDAIGLTCKEA
jgi:hypothetical protein